MHSIDVEFLCKVVNHDIKGRRREQNEKPPAESPFLPTPAFTPLPGVHKYQLVLASAAP